MEIKQTPPSGLVPMSLTLYLNPVDNTLWADKGPIYGWNKIASTPEVQALIAAIPPTAGGVTQAAFDAAIATINASIALKADKTSFGRTTAFLDFPSIAAFTVSSSLTVTLTGVAVGDTISVGYPTNANTGVLVRAVATAANTLAVRAYNTTGTAVDPVNGSYTFTMQKAV